MVNVHVKQVGTVGLCRAKDLVDEICKSEEANQNPEELPLSCPVPLTKAKGLWGSDGNP